MKFFDYNKKNDFLFYLRSGNFLRDSDAALFVKKGEVVFELNDYGGYKKAIFFNFLHYIVGRTKIIEVIIERLYELKENSSYIPSDYADLLKLWLGEETESFSEYQEQYNLSLKGKAKLINDYIHDKAMTFTESLKTNFEEFYTQIKNDLFLEEMEIHSDELRDKKLSVKALRWEFKYLGRDEKVRLQRREIYLKRQDECLKSD